MTDRLVPEALPLPATLTFPYAGAARDLTMTDRLKAKVQSVLPNQERANLERAENALTRHSRDAQQRAAALVADCLAGLPADVRADLARLAQTVTEREHLYTEAQRLLSQHRADKDADRNSRAYKRGDEDLQDAIESAAADLRAARQALKDAQAPHRAAVLAVYQKHAATSRAVAAAADAEAVILATVAMTEPIVCARAQNTLERLGWF